MAGPTCMRALHVLRPFRSSIRHPFSSTTASSTQPQTYYTLFPKTLPLGAPPTGPFKIDVRSLQQEFFKLQQQSHPDVSKDSTLPASHYINKAYTTLRDPLQRAQYLLSLRGVDVAGDEGTIFEDQADRGSLLMEVMEANEEIDEVGSEEELEPLKKKNDERVAKSLDVLDKAFAEDDITTAKQQTIRLRYWVNIGETLKHWEDGH